MPCPAILGEQHTLLARDVDSGLAGVKRGEEMVRSHMHIAAIPSATRASREALR
jgi:hypothetical protein